LRRIVGRLWHDHLFIKVTRGLLALTLRPADEPARSINGMNLKNMFGQIQANGGNFHSVAPLLGFA
jgi:hypothetical protein